jgi:hypothetical protein
MEKEILKLILAYKKVLKQRVKDTKVEVTPLEAAKYGDLRVRVIRNALHKSHLSPDEAINGLILLNTEIDVILVNTSMRGRFSVKIANLGYKLHSKKFIRVK